jgi:predicted RNA binding protein YcfA (HicA-like mRNA interferase family)
MAKRTPKTGKEFIQLAEKSDKVRHIRGGKGSHVIIEFDDGTSVSVPIHANQELGKGIRHKLLKAFKAAGVLILIMLLVAVLLHVL